MHPPTLIARGQQLRSVAKLNGSEFNFRMVSSGTGQCYVAKMRPNPQQVTNELLVARIYGLLGAAVPLGWRVDKDGDLWLVQEWIGGRLLQEFNGSPEYDEVRKAAWSGAALDMLFANYDGKGVIIDADGKAWRTCWKIGEDGLCNEHETSRSGTVNKLAGMVFLGLPDEALLEQFMRIQQTPGVFDHFTADDQKVLAFRLESYVRQLLQGNLAPRLQTTTAIATEIMSACNSDGDSSQPPGSNRSSASSHSTVVSEPDDYETDSAPQAPTRADEQDADGLGPHTAKQAVRNRRRLQRAPPDARRGTPAKAHPKQPRQTDPYVAALVAEFPRRSVKAIRQALATTGSVDFARGALAPNSLGKAIWEFQKSSGWWRRFADADARILEYHFERNCSAVAGQRRQCSHLQGHLSLHYAQGRLTKNRPVYLFNLAETPMTQLNTQTLNKRAIRRRLPRRSP
eukprot:TRINITY_DN372_c0_g1_i8.p1 TRINITY_DN372_c0_g1~~TRINITY_DN372_c0_g1_i8.p1  ORF type:complete len:457 (+),score=55.52 TRINITY_DN372_c0_g1_i8:64-1434(+)